MWCILAAYMKLCSRSDPNLNECIMKNGREALPYLIKGDPAYHIPSFDPLKIDKVNLEASENVKLYGTNISIIGINLITINDMKYNFSTIFHGIFYIICFCFILVGIWIRD